MCPFGTCAACVHDARENGLVQPAWARLPRRRALPVAARGTLVDRRSRRRERSDRRPRLGSGDCVRRGEPRARARAADRGNVCASAADPLPCFPSPPGTGPAELVHGLLPAPGRRGSPRRRTSPSSNGSGESGAPAGIFLPHVSPASRRRSATKKEQAGRSATTARSRVRCWCRTVACSRRIASPSPASPSPRSCSRATAMGASAARSIPGLRPRSPRRFASRSFAALATSSRWKQPTPSPTSRSRSFAADSA